MSNTNTGAMMQAQQGGITPEGKLRELFRDEFRMKVLRASVPEFVMLVELLLNDLDRQRKEQAKYAQISTLEIERLRQQILQEAQKKEAGRTTVPWWEASTGKWVP
jgi:hypothetical protein